MRLRFLRSKTIHEIQEAFSQEFPFLKLEFYPQTGSKGLKRHLMHGSSLADAGMKKEEAFIDVNRYMTVAELENLLTKELGVDAQVSRKSGQLWLETTMTDGWTLDKQDTHGRELEN
ncbi:hypothetical protein [Terrimonas ferruginea]|uniref:hypothetical protein n=1 Tax=Terrimonas ferruginea TaxID=249 RepID=UPI00041843D0|nr:hypothetical protein [Terrimonas ferruginea]